MKASLRAFTDDGRIRTSPDPSFLGSGLSNTTWFSIFWPARAKRAGIYGSFGQKAGLRRLTPATLVPGIPVFPYSRVFRVFPAKPGYCTFGVSLLLLVKRSEFTSDFWPKEHAPFGQKSQALLAKSSLFHRAFSVKSRLLFGQKPASLLAKSRLLSAKERPYGPNSSIIRPTALRALV